MSSSVKTEDATKSQACKITCDFELLRKTPIFQNADSDVVKLFAYLAKRKKYVPGDLIISSEDEADMAFFIIDGSADVTTSHRGKEVILQHLEKSTLCGELALLARFKWFFNVRAKDDCEVLIITRESFQKVLTSFPDKREKMIEKIIQLRVERFIEQTDFMLDNLPESYINQSVWSPSKIAI